MGNYNSNILTNLAKARKRFESMEKEKILIYNFLVGIADALGYKVKKIQDEYNRGPYGIVFDDPEMPIKLLKVSGDDEYGSIKNYEIREEFKARSKYGFLYNCWSNYEYPESETGLTEEYMQECITAIKEFIVIAKKEKELREQDSPK